MGAAKSSRRLTSNFKELAYANIQRGLHFGDFGPGDQGAYATT